MIEAAIDDAPEHMRENIEDANRQWVQEFVQMALNDEEDQMEWDSSDEDHPEAWVIPER
jgi:E3 ubiquitin-protein ligase RNF14